MALLSYILITGVDVVVDRQSTELGSVWVWQHYCY